jgi:acetyl-CoA synthetase
MGSRSVLGHAPLLTGRRNLLLHLWSRPNLHLAVRAEFNVTNFTAAPTLYRAFGASNKPVLSVKVRCCVFAS